MNQNKLNNILLIILVISLISSLVYVFYHSLFGAKDCQEVEYVQSDVVYNLPLDVYVVNNYITEFEVKENIEFTKSYLGEYEINVSLNNLSFIEISNYSRKDSGILFDISDEDTGKECPNINKTLEKLISKAKFNDNIRDVIYLDSNASNVGRGCLCNCRFITLKKEKNIFGSFNKRNLLHEIGHNLGLQHTSNLEKNLMTEGLVKVFHNSICINSSQVQTIRNTLRDT